MDVRMPDGSIIRNVPEGTTQTELLNLYQGFRGRGGQSPLKPLSTEGLPTLRITPAQTEAQKLRQGISQHFGIPARAVDLTQGVPATVRADLGLLSDPQAGERLARMRQIYPQAKVVQIAGQPVVQLSPGQPPLLSNPPGLESGDFMQFGAETGPAIGGALAGAALAGLAAPTGPGAAILAASGGAGAAELLREGVQKALGTSRETPGEYLTRAGISAGMELLPGLSIGGRALYRALRGRGGQQAASEVEKLLATRSADELNQVADELRRSGDLDLPPLQVFQSSDNPMVRAVAEQATQFSKEAQDRANQQMVALREAALRSVPEAGGPGSADELMQDALSGYYRRTRQQIAPRQDPTQTGLAFQRGVDEGLGALKQEMGRRYARRDELLQRWQPKYDVSNVQRWAKDREVQGLRLDPVEEAEIFGATGPALVGVPEGATLTGELLGSTWYRKNPQYLNVADPNQKLRRINAVMARLDPRQDFDVVSDLRSQVGRILELPLAQKTESNADIGLAKKLYGELSSVMENPLDVVEGARRGIINATREANRFAKGYYDNFDASEVLRVLQSTQGQTPTQLADYFLSHPQAMESSLRNLIDQVPNAQKAEVFGPIRRNLESAILRSEDPLASFRQWGEKNPQAMGWLFPNDRSRALAEKNAKILKDLNSSVAREADEAGKIRIGIAERALNEAAQNQAFRGTGRRGMFRQGKRAARDLRGEERVMGLMRQLGAEGEDHQLRRALRSSLLSDVIQNSLDMHKTGVRTINPKEVRNQINRLQDSFYWDTLITERDKKVLGALRDYAQRTWKSGDMGIGLAIASQVGRIRHGDPGAIANVAWSRRLADWLTDTEVPYQALFKKIQKGKAVSASPYTSTVLTAIRQSLATEMTPQTRWTDEDIAP